MRFNTAAIIDKTICIYRADGTLLNQTAFDQEGVFALDWHPFEDRLTMCTQNELSVWDIHQDSPKPFRNDIGFQRAATWSPDGKQIASTALDRTDVMLWNSNDLNSHQSLT